MATDAIDDFIALPEDEQVSMLKTLPRENQDALLEKVKQRKNVSSYTGVKVTGTNAAGKPTLAPVESSTWDEAKKAFSNPSNWQQALSSAWNELKSASPTGMAALFKPPQTTAEKVATFAGPAAVPAMRLAQSEWEGRKKLAAQAANQFKGGHPVLGGASTILAALPIPGVAGMGAGINEAEESGDTAGAAGKGLVDAGLLGSGFVTEGLAKIVPPALRRGAEILTKTGPRETAKLVEDTATDNAAEAAKAADKNAGITADRSAEVKQHFEKAQANKAANEAVQNAKDRKVALERGVEHLDPEIKSELEKTEDSVNEEANRRYTELRATLKDKEAAPYQPVDENGHTLGEPISIVERLYDVASGPLRGTETETPIIRSLGKRTEQGDGTLTYNDLQGYREEVGRELRKGTLPPDVFAAYKGLMNSIDDAMDGIAEKNGMKPQQDAARAYYRQYAETFLDRTSPIRKALDSTERGQTIKSFSGKDQSGVEQLAKFNPELARRINTVRGYQSEAKAITPPKTPPKVAPELKPAKPHVSADVTRLGPEEITAAKAAKMQSNAESLRTYGLRRALYVAGATIPEGILSAIMGHPTAGGIVGIGVPAGVLGFSHILANVMEKPGVVKWLSEPTAGDLEALKKLPPEQRTAAAQNLQPLIDAAKNKGIKVNPAIVSFAAATGTSLPPNHPLAKPPQ